MDYSIIGSCSSKNLCLLAILLKIVNLVKRDQVYNRRASIEVDIAASVQTICDVLLVVLAMISFQIDPALLLQWHALLKAWQQERRMSLETSPSEWLLQLLVCE